MNAADKVDFKAGDNQKPKPADVTPGRAFVNTTGMLRLITAEAPDRKTISYDAYDLGLGDGAFFSDGICSKRAICAWARRAATTEEIAAINKMDGTKAEWNQLVSDILQTIPTGMLLAELERRGPPENVEVALPGPNSRKD